MKEYTLSDVERRALAPYHREFQAAVAVVANRALGNEIIHPQAIMKYEGGVTVNRKEIAILSSCVMEDWARSGKTIPEEVAVAKAIQTVAANFQKYGPTAFDPYRDMAKKMRGDPLQSAILGFVR